MGYNNLGAVAADVVALYPGTVANDFGGTSSVTEAISRAVDMVMGALSPDGYQALTEPDLQLVVRRASAGQTSATLGVVPIIAGSVHVWRGQPFLFVERPLRITEWSANDGTATGLVELDSSRFTVNATTGVLGLSDPLSADDQVFASYQVDTTAGTYAVPSLARIAIRGAAAELGSRLYTEANQEWGLVQTYANTFSTSLDRLRNGSLIPDEVRLMRWWEEIQPSSPRGGSVRLFRG